LLLSSFFTYIQNKGQNIDRAQALLKEATEKPKTFLKALKIPIKVCVESFFIQFTN
jgi:hypothetical protein